MNQKNKVIYNEEKKLVYDQNLLVSLSDTDKKIGETVIQARFKALNFLKNQIQNINNRVVLNYSTEESFISLSQSLPLIMDSSSIMKGFDVSKYYGFSEDVVGSAKFYAKSVHGLNNEDVRLSNRLFIPSRRLRGFNTGKVGPKDGEDWVGGNYITTFGLESKFPNLLPEATRTDVSLFLDAGNIWGVGYDSTLNDTNEFRTSIGISANMFTTVGPLSLTLAQALSKSTNDETQTFNFRLGTSF